MWSPHASRILHRPHWLALLSAALLPMYSHAADPGLPTLVWPTDNHRLVEHAPSDFYMHVDRCFDGVPTKAWQGGQFGFVRTPMRFGDAVVETKFHEGIDIRPMTRDAQGTPLDAVRCIAAGTVLHVSSVPGNSNYGNYIVIGHESAEGPFYSLYAHLQSMPAEDWPSIGQSVAAGTPIGRLGFTGAGINRERAHLHLEVCLMVHRDFPQWHNQFSAGENHHGTWNGINLVGLDVAQIYQEQHQGRCVSLPALVRAEKPAWKAVAPNSGRIDLLTRYPWLREGSIDGAASVEISFSRSGLPLQIRAHTEAVQEPRVVWVEDTPLPTTIFTNHRVTKQGETRKLTNSGDRYLRLLCGMF